MSFSEQTTYAFLLDMHTSRSGIVSPWGVHISSLRVPVAPYLHSTLGIVFLILAIVCVQLYFHQTNGFELPFISSIWISFVKCLFKSIFFGGVTSFVRILNMLWMNSLSNMCIANVLYPLWFSLFY